MTHPFKLNALAKLCAGSGEVMVFLTYIPEPWQITDHHGESAPKELLREVLALTKMNMNNCTFADGVPITLSFSQKIGDIMKHIPEDGKVQPTYKFYM